MCVAQIVAHQTTAVKVHGSNPIGKDFFLSPLLYEIYKRIWRSFEAYYVLLSSDFWVSKNHKFMRDFLKDPKPFGEVSLVPNLLSSSWKCINQFSILRDKGRGVVILLQHL